MTFAWLLVANACTIKVVDSLKLLVNNIFVSLKAWLSTLILDYFCSYLLKLEYISWFKAMDVKEVQVFVADEIFKQVLTPLIGLSSNSNIIALCQWADLYNSAALVYINLFEFSTLHLPLLYNQ